MTMSLGLGGIGRDRCIGAGDVLYIWWFGVGAGYLKVLKGTKRYRNWAFIFFCPCRCAICLWQWAVHRAGEGKHGWKRAIRFGRAGNLEIGWGVFAHYIIAQMFWFWRWILKRALDGGAILMGVEDHPRKGHEYTNEGKGENRLRIRRKSIGCRANGTRSGDGRNHNRC